MSKTFWNEIDAEIMKPAIDKLKENFAVNLQIDVQDDKIKWVVEATEKNEK